VLTDGGVKLPNIPSLNMAEHLLSCFYVFRS